MRAIQELAETNGTTLVEDSGHALFAKYRGQSVATFAPLAALSFHETKNFSCGEGGALVINDPEYISRAEVIREKGTNRVSFLRGEIDKYSWVDQGSSYLLSDLLAATCSGSSNGGTRTRRSAKRIWDRYLERLGPWAEANGVRLPVVPEQCEPAYHLFYLLLPSSEDRAGLIAYLKARGIESSFHYVPLHLSPMGRGWGYQAG
jgi:dTDP-4-amino-4,6-dideoxygalactose transaminase